MIPNRSTEDVLAPGCCKAFEIEGNPAVRTKTTQCHRSKESADVGEE
jgi:hypothetical protein